ncbi:serine/threonine protein kinase [Streptomyces qinglanensis]|uniref:serine/threonine protein kinase n=1 Tax=Streptomyces qinglanensis TaxID=943816 RepID=UPI0037A76A89
MLVSVPLPGTDTDRFLAEATASRHLLGPWASPAAELAADGTDSWHARPYLPALSLPAALRAHNGPLPERTVRALGAALLVTLVVGHGQGLAHAGVSPGAVLLGVRGPRLTCFGAVRAAAEDGTPRSGLPGLESGSLPPEQADGGRPRPLGDLYALGATLAYAATGHTVPERREIPSSLRDILTRCLARDPANRPAPAELLDVLSPLPDTGGSAAADGIPAAEPSDAVSVQERAAVLLTSDWLPGSLVAALARQSARVLTTSLPNRPADPRG